MKMKADAVIVGTGVGGLFSALNLPRDKKIIMITKSDLESSDSFLAQGGICMLHDEDDYDSYFEDTMKAGHYENRKESVDIMIRSSREIIQDLIGYLHDEGIVYYDWNSLSGDAVDASLTPSELNDNILGYVHANAGDSVILMHDLQNNHATIEALPALIQTLKDEGYEICPIDDSTKPVQHVEYKGDK